METYRRVRAETREKYDKLEHSWQTGEGKYVQIIESAPGSKNIFYAEPLPQPNHPSEEEIEKCLRKANAVLSPKELYSYGTELIRQGLDSKIAWGAMQQMKVLWYKEAAKAISTLFSYSDNQGAIKEKLRVTIKYLRKWYKGLSENDRPTKGHVFNVLSDIETIDQLTAISTLFSANEDQSQPKRGEAQERRSKARDHLGGWFFIGCPDSDLLHEVLDIAAGLPPNTEGQEG